MVQIPDQGFLVRCAGNQAIMAGKGRPLHVGNLPQGAMGKMTGRRVGIVKIYDVQAFARRENDVAATGRNGGGADGLVNADRCIAAEGRAVEW